MGNDQTSGGGPETQNTPATDEPPVQNEAQLRQQVRATTGRERYRTEISVRQHALTVDEPPEVGGGDAGPTPFDLVCAALAACTTITLRMYADRKGWPLENIDARVEHARVQVERDGATSSVDRFTLSIALGGDLDDAQRGRLTEIAGRCPVHRLLVAGAVVEVREGKSADNAADGETG